jgi:hypothetical protein
VKQLTSESVNGTFFAFIYGDNKWTWKNILYDVNIKNIYYFQPIKEPF